MSKSYHDRIATTGFLLKKLNDTEAVFFISQVKCIIDHSEYIKKVNQFIPIKIDQSKIHDMYTCDVNHSECELHKPKYGEFRQFFRNLQIGDSIEFEFYAIRKDITYSDKAAIRNLTDYTLYINTYDHYQRLPHSLESIKFLRRKNEKIRIDNFIRKTKKIWRTMMSIPQKFTAYLKKTDKFWFFTGGFILVIISYFLGKREWIESIIKSLLKID